MTFWRETKWGGGKVNVLLAFENYLLLLFYTTIHYYNLKMKPETEQVSDKPHDEYQYLQLVKQVIENGESIAKLQKVIKKYKENFM